MDLTTISALDRSEVTSCIDALGLDCGPLDDLDTDDLQGLLFSFVSSCDRFEEIFEVCLSFQQPFDLVQSLLESNEWKLSSALVGELFDLGSQSKDIIIPLILSGNLPVILPDKLYVGRVLTIVDNYEPSTPVLSRRIRFGDPPVSATHCTWPGLSFGMQRVEIGADTCTALVSCALYEYGHALDATIDLIYWGWSGEWSSALEGSLLELLVAVDDDLVSMLHSIKSMLAMMSPSAAQDLADMIDTVQRDVQAALCDRSAYAVGRLHEVLNQILDMAAGPASSMPGLLSVPVSFSAAVHSFIRAKLDSTPRALLLLSMERLLSTATRYREVIVEARGDTQKVDALLAALTARMSRSPGQGIELDLSREAPLRYEEVRAICAAAPVQLDAMRAMQPSRSGPTARVTEKLYFSFAPVIKMECISDVIGLKVFVGDHSECLYGNVVQIGSMMGYDIKERSISDTCAVLTSILNAGLGYVASKTDKLMALLPLNRSMVLLYSSEQSDRLCIPKYLCGVPKPLLKRSKDMHRIFRNKVRKPLSLRINSDLDVAIALLRAHHGEDCWVGAELEKAWRLMARTTPPMLMVFELWYGEKMIAADFCHPVNGGRSVYVATRFFVRDDEVRHLQPGFLLALAECHFLRTSGCLVWDLGGVNLCPLMKYKYDLAGTPIERPQSMYLLSSAWSEGPCVGMSNLHTGTVIENLSVHNLLASGT